MDALAAAPARDSTPPSYFASSRAAGISAFGSHVTDWQFVSTRAVNAALGDFLLGEARTEIRNVSTFDHAQPDATLVFGVLRQQKTVVSVPGM